jgi:hypothetical protein
VGVGDQQPVRGAHGGDVDRSAVLRRRVVGAPVTAARQRRRLLIGEQRGDVCLILQAVACLFHRDQVFA